VFVAYASRFDQTLIERRLYLPENWAGDAARRRQAHVPEDVAFATKIAITRELIAAVLDAGALRRWVLADALYGGDYRLRHVLEERSQPHVLAVRSNKILRRLEWEGLVETDPGTVADERPAGNWNMLAAGEGSKGLRIYEWARLAPPRRSNKDHERWLLK